MFGDRVRSSSPDRRSPYVGRSLLQLVDDMDAPAVSNTVSQRKIRLVTNLGGTFVYIHIHTFKHTPSCRRNIFFPVVPLWRSVHISNYLPSTTSLHPVWSSCTISHSAVRPPFSDLPSRCCSILMLVFLVSVHPLLLMYKHVHPCTQKHRKTCINTRNANQVTVNIIWLISHNRASVYPTLISQSSTRPYTPLSPTHTPPPAQ